MLLFLLYLFFTPLGVMLLARRWRWIDKVSPMTVLYIIGLLTANLTSWLHRSDLLSLNDMVGKVCIPLAIPLMLLTCSLSNWSVKKTLKAFFCGLASVLIVTVCGFFLFRNGTDAKRFAQVCGVAIGIYTGGIPNMGAIAQGIGMDSETYLFVTSYDLIVTGLYLIFVICLGRPVFRRLLPTTQTTSDQQHTPKQVPILQTDTPKRAMEYLFVPVLALLIAIASYLLSTLFPDDISTPLLILTLTTLSIGATFLPPVRRINRQTADNGRQPISFNVGLYFVYLFCFSIANACDVRQMNLAGSLNILWFILFVVFGSLVLQILFSKLLKLDGDTTLVTSVALINSPPFVPLVAALLNNKELIVVGITIGLLGYMIGNYLGIGIFYLLI